MADAAPVVGITGASSGVGRATAHIFAAKEGASIGLIARNLDALKKAAGEVEERGGKAFPITADVSDPAQVEEAVGTIEEEFGPIDVWVNNAMVSIYSPIAELEPEEVRRVTEVNYLGYVYGTLSVLRRMVQRDYGTIVQVGSGLARRAIPLQAPYCASKHAIRAFNESLRVELLHDRSRVKTTMVQLPGLNTPHFDVVRSRLLRKVRPNPPVFTPEFAAEAVHWASQHPRKEVVVSGVVALMFLAQKFVPGLLDRYLARFGFESQQTPEPSVATPDNLWEPVTWDPGTEGRFTKEAKDKSLQFFLRKLRS